MIYGFPNGATRQGLYPVISKEKGTRGTETSKYPQEEKAYAIALVAASEWATV